MDLPNIETISAMFGGLITFGGILWKWFVVPVKQALEKIIQLQADINLIKPVVMSISKQFKNNAGTSLADAISRLERANAILEHRYQMVLSHTTFGVYECNASGGCTFSNRTLCEIFGLSHHEMLGNGWIAGIHHEDRERVDTDWSYAVKTGIPFECHYRVINVRTNKQIYVVTKAMQVRDIMGNVVGWYGTLEIDRTIDNIGD